MPYIIIHNYIHNSITRIIRSAPPLQLPFLQSFPVKHDPDGFLGVLTQGELIVKYQMIPDSGAIEILDSV